MAILKLQNTVKSITNSSRNRNRFHQAGSNFLAKNKESDHQKDTFLITSTGWT